MRPLPNTGPVQRAILRHLADGRATTFQVAMHLGMPSNRAGAHLANLRRLRLVTSHPYFKQRPMGRPVRQIWSLA